MASLRKRRAQLSAWASVSGGDRLVHRVYLHTLRPVGAEIRAGRVHGLYEAMESPEPRAADDILRRFVALAWRKADVRAFVATFGALELTDAGWPSGWITYRTARFPSSGTPHGPLRDEAGEPVELYLGYSHLAGALLEIAQRCRERRPGLIAPDAVQRVVDHWRRLQGEHREDWPAAVSAWTGLADSRFQHLSMYQDLLRTKPSSPDLHRLFHEVIIVLHWWLEAGGCTPSVSWMAPPSTPMVGWRGGAWGGVGLALLRAVEGSKGLAICDGCLRPIVARKRGAPERRAKMGQRSWCDAEECRRIRIRLSVRQSRARR